MLYTDTVTELTALAVCSVLTLWLLAWAVGGAYALHLLSNLEPELLWQMQLAHRQ